MILQMCLAAGDESIRKPNRDLIKAAAKRKRHNRPLGSDF